MHDMYVYIHNYIYIYIYIVCVCAWVYTFGPRGPERAQGSATDSCTTALVE